MLSELEAACKAVPREGVSIIPVIASETCRQAHTMSISSGVKWLGF